MKTRVLHIVKSLGLGGTEKVMQLMVSHLDRDRFSPLVLAAESGPREAQLREAGIPVIIASDIFTVLEQVRPDIVHIHRAGWPEPALTRPLLLHRRARKGCLPRVVETNVFGRRDASAAGAVVDMHLFVSRFCARRYAAVEGVPTDPPLFDVLYNPVDTDLFGRLVPRADFSRPVVGRISRPDPGKWSDLALDFLPELLQRFPELEYRIIGGTPQAQARVRELGVESAVSFLPPVVSDREIAEFLSGCSVLAHANDTGESFGLVIAEAMAAGLPVVTHPCPGLRDNAQLELVQHESTGYVASDARAYAAALARILESPEHGRILGEAGRARAGSLFRVQDIVRRLENHYDTLLADAC